MLNLTGTHLPVIWWKANTLRNVSCRGKQNHWSNDQENRKAVQIQERWEESWHESKQEREVGWQGRRQVWRRYCQKLPMTHLWLKAEANVSWSSLTVYKLKKQAETADLVQAAYFPTYCCCFDPLEWDRCRFSFAIAIQSLIPASNWAWWGS